MSYADLTIGVDAPDVINVVIEIPKGSHHKYEYDEKLDLIKLDRVLHSPVFYPTDYGFIPQTRSEDQDHLDALVLITDPVFSGCVVPVRPIGVLYMEDQKEKDEKIIAVAVGDPVLDKIKDVNDIDEFFRKEIHTFFETYKLLEKKVVKVQRWHGKEIATKIINEAVDRYQAEG
jgi:inorganic pyrophosphatase